MYERIAMGTHLRGIDLNCLGNKVVLETKVYGQRSGVEGHNPLGSGEYGVIDLKCNKTQKGKCLYLALPFGNIFL